MIFRPKPVSRRKTTEKRENTKLVKFSRNHEIQNKKKYGISPVESPICGEVKLSVRTRMNSSSSIMGLNTIVTFYARFP